MKVQNYYRYVCIVHDLMVMYVHTTLNIIYNSKEQNLVGNWLAMVISAYT